MRRTRDRVIRVLVVEDEPLVVEMLAGMLQELNYTLASGKWQDREWVAVPASLDEPGKVAAELPEDTTVYYFNLFDDRDCVVSTEHVEVEVQ